MNKELCEISKQKRAPI